MTEVLSSPSSNGSFLRFLFAQDDLRFLEALYWIYLGRDIDADGRRTLLRHLREGLGRSTVIASIAASDEARQKGLHVPWVLTEIVSRGTDPFVLEELARLEDPAFLRLAYRTIMRREPDDDGFRVFGVGLREGGSRDRVLSDLRNSPEGRAVGIDLPEIDRAIARIRRGAIPLLGRFLSSARYTSEKRDIRDSLRRIEGNLIEFRNLPMGEKLATRLPHVGGDAQKAFSALAELPSTTGASRQVVGNVAVSALAWSADLPINRILLLKLDHIGDFFVSVRAMSMIRDAWPAARITLVCGLWNVGLAKQLAIFDEIQPYNFFSAKTSEEEFDWDPKDWENRCNGIRELNLGAFDLAVDLRHDADTRPIMTRVETKLRAGFASPGGPLPPTPPLDLFLIETRADLPDQMHAEARLVALAAMIVETLCPPKRHPIRRLIKTGVALPFQDRPYMVVAPGAGSPNRTWPAPNFISLMQKALEKWKVGLVLVGANSEHEVNAHIASSFDDDDCVNLTGGALTDLPAVLDGARLFVGNDTGSGHLAALLGTPTLCVYAGVSDPRVWQPVGQSVSIVHSQTPCSYCHINLRKDCRHELRCLSEITVHMAWTELQRLHTKSRAERDVYLKSGA